MQQLQTFLLSPYKNSKIRLSQLLYSRFLEQKKNADR
jgi:hypothetical protein